MLQIQRHHQRYTIYSISICQILLCAFIPKNLQLKNADGSVIIRIQKMERPRLRMWERCSSPYACHSEYISSDNGEKNVVCRSIAFLGENVNIVSKEERLDNVVLVGWMEESTTLLSLFNNTKRPVGDDAAAHVILTSALLPLASVEAFIIPISNIFSSNGPTSIIKQTSIFCSLPPTSLLLPALFFETHHFLMFLPISIINGRISPSCIPCAAAPTNKYPTKTAETAAMDVAFDERGYIPSRFCRFCDGCLKLLFWVAAQYVKGISMAASFPTYYRKRDEERGRMVCIFSLQ